MKNQSMLTRLLLAGCLTAASGLALAQTGTTPGTTPTNPAPESMGTPKSTPDMGSGGNSSMSMSMPTQDECDQMKADHKKNPSMAMDDSMKAKMKQCKAMSKKKMSN